MIGGSGEASVVRSENNEGFFVKFQSPELFHYASHTLIHTFYHGGVNWVALPFFLWNGLVFFNHCLLGLQRRVYRIVGEVEKEWLPLILPDEGYGFVGQSVGQVFPILPSG